MYLYKTTTFPHQPLRSISKVAVLHRFYCICRTASCNAIAGDRIGTNASIAISWFLSDVDNNYHIAIRVFDKPSQVWIFRYFRIDLEWTDSANYSCVQVLRSQILDMQSMMKKRTPTEKHVAIVCLKQLIYILFYFSLGYFRRKQIDVFVPFPNLYFRFHANCLLRTQFASNVKANFLGKKIKQYFKMSSADISTQHAKWSRN